MAPFVDKLSRNLSITGMVAAAELAVGFGVGTLVAGAMKDSTRQKVGTVVLAAGIAASIPVLIGAIVRLNHTLTEERRTRRQLDTIRHDAGLAEDGDVF